MTPLSGSTRCRTRFRSGAVPHGRRHRGAIALEYILIAALVAIAIIATCQLWGRAVATAVGEAVTDSHGALEAP